MDEANTVQVDPAQDSGPGPMDVLEARMTLRLRGAHDAVTRLLTDLQELAKGPEGFVLPPRPQVNGLPHRLRNLANQLDAALQTIRTVEDLRAEGQW